MKFKAILFDCFVSFCDYFNAEKVESGFGCDHTKQKQKENVDGVNFGKCSCCSCPLGISAEQEDLDATNIDWDGLCQDGEVYESEYLLINIGKESTEEQKKALKNYDRYLNRYNFDFKE